MASEAELRRAAGLWSKRTEPLPAGKETIDLMTAGMMLGDWAAEQLARPMDGDDKAAVERLKLKATAEYDPYAKAVMVSVDDLKRVLAMVEAT